MQRLFGSGLHVSTTAGGRSPAVLKKRKEDKKRIEECRHNEVMKLLRKPDPKLKEIMDGNTLTVDCMGHPRDTGLAESGGRPRATPGRGLRRSHRTSADPAPLSSTSSSSARLTARFYRPRTKGFFRYSTTMETAQLTAPSSS